MSIEGPLPPDVDPTTHSRVPPIIPDQLDETGRSLYDSAVTDPHSIVGLRGPSGIRLHNPTLYELTRPVNRYLRFESGFDPRLREIAILAAAREMDNRFEWRAHETEATKLGVAPQLIDLIRHRRPLDGLKDPEATIVRLTREAIGEHKVRPETFARARALFDVSSLLVLTELIAELRRYGDFADGLRAARPAGNRGRSAAPLTGAIVAVPRLRACALRSG